MVLQSRLRAPHGSRPFCPLLIQAYNCKRIIAGVCLPNTRKMGESRRLTAASERTRLNRSKNQLRFFEQ